jgi:predicted unusual protein kinase regulating ubiquinone biosynthesis (AarF/ABC1/UbiB family)
METHPSRISRLSQLGRFPKLVRLFLWTLWVMYRERRRVIRTQAPGSVAAQPASPALLQVLAAFSDAAVKQDVLLIKLGQFLSTRIDLLPEQATLVLSSLQDEVPPAPFARVVGVIEAELGKPVEEVFSALERKSTAAASLGQVHKAVLASTGETVAVKIQRPQIERLVRLDLRALKFVIWVMTRFVDAHHVVDLMGFYDEFARTIDEELDYVREAANAKRFQAMFKDDPTICIPQVYDQYVTRRLLVLEWVDGITIDDDAALDAAGINRFEQEIGQLLGGQSLRIPARFAFIGRAVGILMGLAQGLAPEFNFIEVARPYARAFLRLDARGVEQAAHQIFRQALGAGRTLLALPQAVEQVVSKLEAGELEVILASLESRGGGSVRGRRSGRGSDSASAVPDFTWPFIFAASLAGGIFLLAGAHQFIASWFCLALAGLCMVRAWVKN